MHSAAILAEENVKLRAANQRSQYRIQQRRQYIAARGAPEAEEGRRLIVEANRVVPEDDHDGATSRQRAPPTCSKCHEIGQ